MEKICKNCELSNKRGKFSFKKYGDRHCSFECLKNDELEFKRLDDTCDDFMERKENQNA